MMLSELTPSIEGEIDEHSTVEGPVRLAAGREGRSAPSSAARSWSGRTA